MLVASRRPELVGRDPELFLLRGLIDVSRGRGQALVFTGDAGVGKSVLLGQAATLARTEGCLVLRAAGVQAEAQFPFGGLHQLLGPVIRGADALPTPQRLALLTALGIEAGPTPILFLTALATLTVLAEEAARQPVLLVADDLNWLDQASQSVLAFVARRLGDDPMSLVAAVRADQEHAFVDVPAHVHTVEPLAEDAARRVLERHSGPLSRADREGILAVAQGNPLALVELPRAWRSARSRWRAPRELPPITHRLQRAFVGRAEHLPPVTRDLLLVAALTDTDDLGEMLAATSELSGHPVRGHAADPAVEAGLVRYDAACLTFRHPLVRSAIMAAESEGRRQRANLALAAVLAAQPHRRVRFAAAAVIGPDEQLASELEEEAVASLRRGAVLDAVWALERAAGLALDLSDRTRRLLLAAEQAFSLGRADLVTRLVAEAASGPQTAGDQARISWLREIFEDGDPGNEARLLEMVTDALKAASVGDPDLALNLLVGAALRCWWSDASPSSRSTVVAALQSTGVGREARAVAVLALAEPMLRGGEVIAALAGRPAADLDDADELRLWGMSAWAVGDAVRCVDLLERAVGALRAQGRLGVLSHALSMQANARVALGEWAWAAHGVTEAHRLSLETGQPIWATGSRSVGAMLAGLRGEAATVLQSAEEEAYARSRGLADQLACLCLARAFAHAGQGRHDEALRELLQLFDPASPSHHERESLHGLMFLAEAAAGARRLQDGQQVLDRMEHLALRTPSPLLHAHLLYARPVLAEGREAEELFVLGLAEDLTRWPWVRARLQLAYGIWLRRHRRAVESRPPLRAAADTLGAMGATHWAQRARAELRAAGERPVDPPSPLADLLSPQELQIAQLAADGLSNKEIGEQLFCSARTVASHLYHLFPKLQITSRTQLAGRLGALRVMGSEQAPVR